jgi:hypothetical protein
MGRRCPCCHHPRPHAALTDNDPNRDHGGSPQRLAHAEWPHRPHRAMAATRGSNAASGRQPHRPAGDDPVGGASTPGTALAPGRSSCQVASLSPGGAGERSRGLPRSGMAARSTHRLDQFMTNSSTHWPPTTTAERSSCSAATNSSSQPSRSRTETARRDHGLPLPCGAGPCPPISRRRSCPTSQPALAPPARGAR